MRKCIIKHLCCKCKHIFKGKKNTIFDSKYLIFLFTNFEVLLIKKKFVCNLGHVDLKTDVGSPCGGTKIPLYSWIQEQESVGQDGAADREQDLVKKNIIYQSNQTSIHPLIISFLRRSKSSSITELFF